MNRAWVRRATRRESAWRDIQTSPHRDSERPPLPGAIGDQAELDIRAIAERGDSDLAPSLRREQNLRQAVVDNVGEFTGFQRRIDAGIIEPRPCTRDATLDVARVVFHEDGIVVESLEPHCPQEMGKSITARLKLTIGDGLARSGHDDGRLVSALNGVLARVHPFLPLRARIVGSRRPFSTMR